MKRLLLVVLIYLMVGSWAFAETEKPLAPDEICFTENQYGTTTVSIRFEALDSNFVEMVRNDDVEPSSEAISYICQKYEQVKNLTRRRSTKRLIGACSAGAACVLNHLGMTTEQIGVCASLLVIPVAFVIDHCENTSPIDES